MSEIHELDLIGDRSKRIATMLSEAAATGAEWAGGDLGGFALVTWDMRGDCRTAICCDVGPVGQGLVPAYTHDALQRHVTVLVAGQSQPAPLSGDGV